MIETSASLVSNYLKENGLQTLELFDDAPVGMLIYARNGRVCHLYIIGTRVTINGSIGVSIFQSEEMGANVTSIAESNTGIIKIVYNDYSPNIGAVVTLKNFAGFFPGSVSDVGFKPYETLPTNPTGYRFTSKDFPAKCNYNLTLNRITYDPDYFWNLYSEPI